MNEYTKINKENFPYVGNCRLNNSNKKLTREQRNNRHYCAGLERLVVGCKHCVHYQKL